MNVIDLTAEFVSYNTVSNLSNAKCSAAMAKRMREAGLSVERLQYADPNGVTKVCLVGKKGKGKGGLAMMGHNDVVPAEGWAWDPFKLTKKKGLLYGRGSADMKGSVACMIATAERFNARDLKQPIYVVVTSDEEINCGGAAWVHKHSKTLKGCKYGIIGEPTMLDVVYAHKGSFKIDARAKGLATHSSTGKGTNANHLMIPFLNEVLKLGEKLKTDRRYTDKTFTPPYSPFNIVWTEGNTASNITAENSAALVNTRPIPGHDWEPVKKLIREMAKKYGVKAKISDSLTPLNTPIDSRIVSEALSVTGKRKPKTVSYGTDGMIFGKSMELVVLGPGNIKQAHTIDEWIEPDQLKKGVDIFAQMVIRFCIEDPA
ncbi:MAG: acetylornithine deacetylase [Gemmatimonadetes bacterium]|nr:acetylornithine deacetylase [Gemmatimonadota bacterium]